MAYYNCIIRNPKSGVVLQVKDPRVLIDNFSGYDPQRWQVHTVGVGLNLIVNKTTGKALDIQGDVKASAPVITSAVRGRDGDARQHWYINSDNTIASAVNANLVLDICEGKFTPGNCIIVYPKTGNGNQKFNFEYQ